MGTSLALLFAVSGTFVRRFPACPGIGCSARSRVVPRWFVYLASYRLHPPFLSACVCRSVRPFVASCYTQVTRHSRPVGLFRPSHCERRGTHLPVGLWLRRRRRSFVRERKTRPLAKKKKKKKNTLFKKKKKKKKKKS